MPMVFAALACSFSAGGDQTLKETDIAIGIQQTLVAQTAIALETSLAAPATAVPLGTTASSSPEVTTPITPALTGLETQPVTSTDTPQATATSESTDPVAVQLTDWKLAVFAPINSGCKLDDAPCWLLKMSGSGLWKSHGPTEGVLTTREPILIDPSWENPALVFWHKFESTGFGYQVNLQVNGKWSGVRQNDLNTAGWVQEVVKLNDYKGKELNVSFLSTVVVSWLRPNLNVSWYIQDVQIVPNYQTPP
jgi:hypothetical protein